MKIPAAILGVLLLSTAARGEPLTYEQCLALVRGAPEQALGDATRWADAGGGAPAAHCASLALVALQRYDEAAQTLERIASDPSSGTNEARAELLAQAGNAWLLADNPRKGAQDLTRALAFAPGDIGLLADRARAYFLAGRASDALDDIGKVLAQTPSDPDALLLRAKIKSQNGDAPGARADGEEALKNAPAGSETEAAIKALLSSL